MQGAEVLTRFTADTKDFDSKAKGLNTSISSIAKGVLVATGVTKAMSTAWSMVSRNMGTAISRYDTLQNFPKVMKNFGVSSEEAAKSVDRIADSVLGLPTSLDQAVSGVQNIFMVTKDLKKAEAMFQAVNDSAMVFANGSTEAVDRFIYAYKQALSSGKVMAQDFNQMNEAIPGLMDKVAESMGVTFTELKEGLSNGTISTNQFNEALKKLDTEGVGSMGALRDSAFEATGGIGTAIKNMNSRISAGLAEMIGAVNKGLKEAGLGDIATILSNVGATIKEALIAAAPYITETIIKLKELFDFVSKNQETIKSLAIVIGTLVAAIKLYNLNVRITNTLAKINAETHIFTKAAMLAQAAATKIVTIAQAGLNLVMSLNPIVLVIAAIVALIAIFVVLWKKCDWFRNFWIGLWNNIVSFVQNAVNTVVSVFNTVVNFVKNNWQGLLLLLVNPFWGAFKLLYDNCSGFRNFINNFVKGIVNLFKSLPGQMISIGKNIISGIINGMTGMVGTAINKAKSIGKSILNGVKSVLGIHSPSTEFAFVGKMSVLGFTNELDKMQKQVQSQITETFNQRCEDLNEEIRSDMSDEIQALYDAIGEGPPAGDGGTLGERISALEEANEQLENDLASILGMLEKPPTYSAPSVSLTISPNRTIHNESTEITITPKFYQNDAGQMTSYRLTKGSEVLAEGSVLESYKDTVTLQHGGSQASYSVTVTYLDGPIKNTNTGRPYPNTSIKAGSVSGNATIRAYAYSYYGVINTSTVSESDIASLSKVILTGRPNTVTYNLQAGQRSVYMYPSNYGALTSVKDTNNFDYINSYTMTTMTYNGLSYNVYVLTDPVEISGFKQIFN